VKRNRFEDAKIEVEAHVQYSAFKRTIKGF